MVDLRNYAVEETLEYGTKVTIRAIRRDDQEALRRHEGAYPLHQPICVVEGAERGRVVRENAQDPASILDWDRAAHATSHLLLPSSPSPCRDARGSCTAMPLICVATGRSLPWIGGNGRYFRESP